MILINPSLVGKEESFPCMIDEHYSSFHDYCLLG